MNQHLLNEDDISEWCGYKRRGDIERWLKEEGIQFFRGRGGKLLTTMGLIQAAKQGAPHEVDFDFVHDEDDGFRLES